MTYSHSGRALMMRHCSLLTACGESRFSLQFNREMNALELAALRDFVVDHFTREDRALFFGGAWQVGTAASLGSTPQHTRMVFLVRAVNATPYDAANQNIRPKLMDALLREMAAELHLSLWAKEGLWFKPNKSIDAAFNGALA